MIDDVIRVCLLSQYKVQKDISPRSINTTIFFLHINKTKSEKDTPLWRSSTSLVSTIITPLTMLHVSYKEYLVYKCNWEMADDLITRPDREIKWRFIRCRQLMGGLLAAPYYIKRSNLFPDVSRPLLAELKCYEAKWKMKHPSDVARSRFEPRR